MTVQAACPDQQACRLRVSVLLRLSRRRDPLSPISLPLAAVLVLAAPSSFLADRFLTLSFLSRALPILLMINSQSSSRSASRRRSRRKLKRSPRCTALDYDGVTRAGEALQSS